MAYKRIIKENPKEEEILKKAIALFKKNGYAQTSIRDIAKKSKTSIGIIYYYFKNKKDILKKILINLKPSFNGLYCKCDDKMPFNDCFKRLCKNLIDYNITNLKFYRLLLNESLKDKEFRSFLYAQYKSEISVLATWLNEYSLKRNARRVDYEKLAVGLVCITYSMANINNVFKSNLSDSFFDDMLEILTDVSINGIINKEYEDEGNIQSFAS